MNKKEINRMYGFDGAALGETLGPCEVSGKEWNDNHRRRMIDVEASALPKDNYMLSRAERIKKYSEILTLCAEVIGHVANDDISEAMSNFAYLLHEEIEEEMDLTYHAAFARTVMDEE